MLLTLNYRYRLYPDATQQQRVIEWMEIYRTTYNYGWR
ncbi:MULTISPECIES: helix-turn-helix domain-containing protein [unclassified Moorena]|nr:MULTISPECIES: helix-turn-helix domain-containing protein [unclassified Moorena]